ncbi:MAG: phosphatidate cytidylyltransferase [Betaproteobacteria bacterium]|nr:phosphatidate cytidylyltransferase [Betaproteobacteria bacterium]
MPDLGWTILISAVVGVAAWEWAGLAGFGKKGRVAYGVGLFVAMSVISAAILVFVSKDSGMILLSAIYLALLSCLFWFVVVPLWFRFRWSLKGVIGLVIGIIVLIPACLVAIIMVIHINSKLFLVIISFAWVADIAAYATGRLFGRHKLAPTISPGKTWEGAAGAFVAVFFCFYAWLFLVGPSAESIMQLIMLLCLAFALTAACILGDLFESLLKRQAGVKDSSNLLPGHGGVLDRIDSVLALLAISPALILILWVAT